MYVFSVASRRGFTLIELLIVPGVIGLIVGGMLAGQSQIKSPAIRAQISQVNIPRQSRISANLFEKIFAPAICACEVLRLSLWLSGPSLPACRSEQGPVESLQ